MFASSKAASSKAAVEALKKSTEPIISLEVPAPQLNTLQQELRMITFTHYGVFNNR
jgi:hypothetical protein